MISTADNGPTRQKQYRSLDIEKAQANLPASMRAVVQWCVWKLEPDKKGRLTKIPYNARGGPGSSTDQTTWSTFDEAIRAYDRGGYDGIGFYFGNGFTGIDIDACRNPASGEIDAGALLIVQRINSYWEVSPSQTGLHLFCKARIPGKGINRNVYGCKIEIYDSGRFFTYTGERLDGALPEASDCQEQVTELYNKVLELDQHQKAEKLRATGKRKSQAAKYIFDSLRLVQTDAKVMDLAFNYKHGDRFQRLWDGDTSEFSSASEADASLVSTLCFFSGNDAQVERLWKESGLYRDKLERPDYVIRTIQWARSEQTAHYSRSYQATCDEPQALTCEETGLAEIYQIESRILTEWNFTDEEKTTHSALAGLMNGKTIHRIGNRILARHICKKENRVNLESGERFASRRVDSLLKRLEPISVRIWTVLDPGGGWYTTKGGQKKRLTKQYHHNRTIFIEALEAAHADPDYAIRPRQALENAAIATARKYLKQISDDETESKASKKGEDGIMIEVNAEKSLKRLASKILNAWDLQELTTGEKQIRKDNLLNYFDSLLLSKKERRQRHYHRQKQIPAIGKRKMG